MTRQQIIDKIADDRIRFVSEFGDHAANERSAARVPLEINCSVKISRAVDLRPAVRTSRLFGPDFDEAELPLQLRIAHDLVAQRPATGRDDLDHRLHGSLG